MRPWKTIVLTLPFLASASFACGAPASAPVALTVENDCAKIVVGTNGCLVGFIDRRSGQNYCRHPSGAPLARVKLYGKSYAASKATLAGERLTLELGTSGVTAVVQIKAQPRHFLVEVLSVSSDAIEEFAFVDIPLSLTGAAQEPFAACALALNLKTRVRLIPQASAQLWAACYPRFGLAGAEVALIACPRAELRQVMQEVVTAAKDLPHSPIGGPWALDAPGNYGSYLFDFGDLTEKTVGRWIEVAQSLGVTQIDFHGGRSFRFGDFRPNPTLYPQGVPSMKAVIDRLHAAGIQAGLHTYAMFINKSCPYVTPVPDPRLGKDATFTLAADLPADASQVPVLESTADMSTITGFFVRNSVTVQIDDELITYAQVAKEPPYAFTKCSRGAYGTKVAPHRKGTPVHHLRECFGLFVPDGDSTLLAEVAAKTAELYNGAGFDMIYLDALDGGDAVAGRACAWHYESKFTFEIFKRLKRPAIMEMSTFHHHLWYVRSRMGAWDHPNRSHKKFIDIHCQANSRLGQQFLPGNLGWWAFKTWHGATAEPTHTDDIEYLGAKALAHNYGLSLMGINPTTARNIPALPRLAAIIRRYECLRLANYFNEAVKEKVAVPGAEVTLIQAPEGQWQFQPVMYDKHKLQGRDCRWAVSNRFGQQPLQLRIEPLMSVDAYDSPDGVTLADFGDVEPFADHAAPKAISASLLSSSEQVKTGKHSGKLDATNSGDTARGSWCKIGRTFDPPLDLSKQQALGVWVFGDGKGELLNLQQTSPSHLTGAIADHYIDVDFTGWRYFELVEPEGQRHADYAWPYGHIYSIYRESIRPTHVEKLSLWYNNIPPKGNVSCYLSPIRALPTRHSTLCNPSVTIGDNTITFPVEIQTGQFLEFRGPGDCTLYGPKGEELCAVEPEGVTPVLGSGANEIRFTCEAPAGINPRAYVSVIAHGEPFGGTNPPDQIRWERLRREDEAPRIVRALDGVQNQWDVICRPDAKQVRLETQIVVESVSPPAHSMYADPHAITLEAFDNLEVFDEAPTKRYLQLVAGKLNETAAAPPGVTQKLALSTDIVKRGKSSLCYTAQSSKPGAWCARSRRFDPPIDLASCTHLGLLVHGDGNGQTAHVQLCDTKGKCHDLRIGIGFSGWKYRECSLLESACDLTQVEFLIIGYTGLPAGKTCQCYIDDVRALRDPTLLRNPFLEVAGQKIVFPVAIKPGQRLVYGDTNLCTLFEGDGTKSQEAKPRGALPALKPGKNRITFGMDLGAGGNQTSTAFQLRIQTTKTYQ